jgi:hypothetical protein
MAAITIPAIAPVLRLTAAFEAGEKTKVIF